MFLVLCGVDVDDDSIAQIKCDALGASMLQLREFCETHGVRTEVRKFDASEIWQSRSGNNYHYFVVHTINKLGIFALDGTTGRQIRINYDRVNDYFTGYALIPIRSSFGFLFADALSTSPTGKILFAVNVALVVILITFPRRKLWFNNNCPIPRKQVQPSEFASRIN